MVEKFLSGDKFMPVRQPGFTYSACGPFTKNKERTQMFKETEDSRYIYQNELDKARFQYDMAYGDFKDLNRRTVPHKILRDKAFDIAKNSKYDGYQRGLASVVYKCFDKKTSCGTVKNENISNKELAEELHKPVIKKLKKSKLNYYRQYLGYSNLIKEFVFYYVLLIFSVNTHGLFL